MNNEDDEAEELESLSMSLENAEDRLILMHREVHFSGSFEHMIAYYQAEGKGINPDIELKRVKELAKIEQQRNKNLASVLLSESDLAEIKKAKGTYEALREIYEQPPSKNKYPKLIADLILSEKENPETEIKKIIAEKNEVVPFLLELLKSEMYANPLFPGYGLAPGLAARCLGAIGDKRAIITLFEAIGEGDVFTEETLVAGLKAIGEPAKQFLMKVLQAKPINRDNERAAIALIAFKDDEQLTNLALDMLKQTDVLKDPFLANYLVLMCEGLQNEHKRQQFMELAADPHFPTSLKLDHAYVCRQWSL